MDAPKEDFSVWLNTDDGHVAVVNLQKVQNALARISDLVEADEPVDRSSLRSSLSDGEDGIQQLSNLFSALMDPIFYNERHTPIPTSATRRTLETNELLEMILLNLDVPSLLAAQSVNHQFFDVIDTTKSLQQKMALLPSGNPLFSTIVPGRNDGGDRDVGDHGLSYETCVPDQYVDYTRNKQFYSGDFTLEMDLFFDFDRRNLPTVGSRWRKMLICEPVATIMTAQYACCGACVVADNVSNDTGITIGNLLDAVQRMREDSKSCPGVWGVTFQCAIKVRCSDPVAVNKLNRPREDGQSEYPDSWNYGGWSEGEDEDGLEELSCTNEPLSDIEDEFSELTHGFEDAKEIAARNGEQSLTFADFEKIGGSSWQSKSRKRL